MNLLERSGVSFEDGRSRIAGRVVGGGFMAWEISRLEAWAEVEE